LLGDCGVRAHPIFEPELKPIQIALVDGEFVERFKLDVRLVREDVEFAGRRR
jgi:hypothetical protein